MPYRLIANGEFRARLEQLGSFLSSARETYFAVWDEDLATPRPGSPAMVDFGTTLLCPSGDPWPKEHLRHTRDIAVKLTRQAADHLVAMGILYGAGEVIDAPIVLARSAFEHATRAYWVLDQRVTHLQRCARADLTELVSLDEVRKTSSGLFGGSNEEIQRLNEDRTKLVEKLKQLYCRLDLNNDYFKWSIDGEKYIRFTEAAECWAQAQNAGMSGVAAYDALSLGSHPQGFLGAGGIFRDEPGSKNAVRVVDLEFLEKLVNNAVLPFYTMLCLLTSYHGLKSVALRGWEDEIDRVLPDSLRGGGS